MADKQDRMGLRLNVFQNAELDYQFARILTTQVSGGATLGECLGTARRLNADGADVKWAQAWSETAMRVQAQAESSLTAGHLVSAREGFLRAANYFRMAGYYMVADDPRATVTWKSSRMCFRLAGALFDPAFTPVEIPYEGTTLSGFFLPGWAGDARSPTVIVMGGFDGSAEELYFHAGWAALRRGYHVLLFEGPGQSGAVNERGLRLRPDYEVPVRAAIDFLARRGDVDRDRIALLGFNWGGHFALRVAAHDRRLRAVIADSPIISLFEHMIGMNPTEVRQILALPPDQLPPMLREQVARVVAASPTLRYYEAALARRLGTGKLLDSFQALRAYDVGPHLHDIQAAALLIVSESEGPGALAQARLAAERIPAPTTLHVFAADEAAAQCQLDNLSGLTSVIFDWLDKVMAEDAVVAA